MTSGPRVELQRHPDTPCSAVTQIEVLVTREGGSQLELRYLLTGRIDEIMLPALDNPGRTDGLWQHTCFEAFVRGANVGGYHEFNFSPSTQWAGYAFSGYRANMRELVMVPPMIEVQATDAHFELCASILLPGDGPLRLGLSAVIEETNGNKSYWALAHPLGKPDFHHPDCFVLELPALERP